VTDVLPPATDQVLPVPLRAAHRRPRLVLIALAATAILIAVGFSGLGSPAAGGTWTMKVYPAQGQTPQPNIPGLAPRTFSIQSAKAAGLPFPTGPGAQIAQRALSWLGWPYSFDGGNAYGPTLGRAVDKDSRNDGHINGFDCSGLVLYALAPWLSVTHLASAQYTEAGSLHPALNQLQPGDLVFWSTNATAAGIGHVAVYIGDGKVVQAPHSGAYVEVTPMDQVHPGLFGATRPVI